MRIDSGADVNLSIVIPTRKRVKELENCLRVLVGQLAEGDEIIVTEDDVALESQNSLKAVFPDVVWLSGPCKGPAANRNNGAWHAKNAYLIFLDDDCVPSSEILASYRAHVKLNPDVDAIEGCIRPIGEKSSLAEECPENMTGNYFWSCNVLFRRDAFVALNGFDEKFPFPCMEDPEIYLRMKKSGMKVPFLKEAYVSHPWVVRTDKRMFQHYRLTMLYYFQKHADKFQKCGYVYVLRLLKSYGKELFVNGLLRGFGGKRYYFSYALNRLSFALMLVNKKSRDRYVRDVKPCCDGCRSLLSILKNSGD